jgi:hypothetical protein
MAAETAVQDFNLANVGDSAKREALSIWYNCRVSHDGSAAGTLASPVWELVGYKLTGGDVSVDYETDETKKDILGNTFVSLSGAKRSIDLSGWDTIKGSHLQVDIMNAMRYENNGGMAYLESGGDFCLVHHYAGSSGAMLAERWSGCGIKPTRQGGDGGGNLTLDATVTFSGEKTIGTAAINGSTMTFTETEAPAWPGNIS